MPKRRSTWWKPFLVPIVTGAIGAIGGGALGLWKYTSEIATKPYVDERFDKSLRYTDDQVGRAIERANAHSDQNRAAMEVKIERVDTKQDSLLEILKLVREQQLEDGRRKR